MKIKLASQYGSFILNEGAKAVIGTVTLSLGFMVFNDYIAPPPSLAGPWKFTVWYQDTSKSFKDLQVTYQALVIQEDLKIKGAGEKVMAESPTIPQEIYEGKDKIQLNITGIINRNYFSRDQLDIYYQEQGAIRTSTTIHELVYFSRKEMCGCFTSTIANTRGKVWWQRIKDRDSLKEPMTPSKECMDLSCTNKTS